MSDLSFLVILRIRKGLGPMVVGSWPTGPLVS